MPRAASGAGGAGLRPAGARAGQGARMASASTIPRYAAGIEYDSTQPFTTFQSRFLKNASMYAARSVW